MRDKRSGERCVFPMFVPPPDLNAIIGHYLFLCPLTVLKLWTIQKRFLAYRIRGTCTSLLSNTRGGSSSSHMNDYVLSIPQESMISINWQHSCHLQFDYRPSLKHFKAKSSLTTSCYCSLMKDQRVTLPLLQRFDRNIFSNEHPHWTSSSISGLLCQQKPT